MLVLTRAANKDAAVDIGGFLTLNVVDWNRGTKTVRIALTTSIEIPIWRDNAVKQGDYQAKKGNLILTRKEGDKVFVGDNIAINVLKVTSHDARIGIDAPRDISILRIEAKAIEPSAYEEM